MGNEKGYSPFGLYNFSGMWQCVSVGEAFESGRFIGSLSDVIIRRRSGQFSAAAKHFGSGGCAGCEFVVVCVLSLPGLSFCRIGFGDNFYRVVSLVSDWRRSAGVRLFREID